MMNEKNVGTKALDIQSREAVKDIFGVKISFIDEDSFQACIKDNSGTL